MFPHGRKTINLKDGQHDHTSDLRDVNKVYRAKGSISSRSVGARCMFGFSAELGNVLLDSMTFTADEPAIVETAANCYANIAQCILNIFPEIASQLALQPQWIGWDLQTT